MARQYDITEDKSRHGRDRGLKALHLLHVVTRVNKLFFMIRLRCRGKCIYKIERQVKTLIDFEAKHKKTLEHKHKDKEQEGKVALEKKRLADNRHLHINKRILPSKEFYLPFFSRSLLDFSSMKALLQTKEKSQ
jgi:hypothetical protein